MVFNVICMRFWILLSYSLRLVWVWVLGWVFAVFMCFGFGIDVIKLVVCLICSAF